MNYSTCSGHRISKFLNCFTEFLSRGLPIISIFIVIWIALLSIFPSIKCCGNQLTTLDVSKNKSLTELDCSPMSTLETLYVSSGQSIVGVAVNRSTNRVPSGTSIKTK